QRITDFRVGAFAIESYSDAGQNPQDAGSLLAHGVIDNVAINVPPPPIQDMTGRFLANVWQVSFLSRTNWIYTLERGSDFQTWSAVSLGASGNGGSLVLQDTNMAGVKVFYRVRAEKP